MICSRAITGTSLALAFSFPVGADFTGKVVAVADGDTVTVLRGRGQVKVRLLDIDAPEKAQAFGNRSKQSLSDLCFNKITKVGDSGKHRCGRTLARVYGDGVDANAEQVRRGMAWVYERYAPKNSPLHVVQAEARAARRGLWVDNGPMPPWKWRSSSRR